MAKFDPYKDMDAAEVEKLKKPLRSIPRFPSHEVRDGKVMRNGREIALGHVRMARQRHGKRVAEIDRSISALQAERQAHADQATALDAVLAQAES